MPVAYEVDHAKRRIWQTATDPLTAADVMRGLDYQVSVGAWTYGNLVDMTQCSWLPSSDEIRAVLKHTHTLALEHGRRGPVAMVTGTNEALFGMYRMYSILGEYAGVVIEAFHTRHQAEAWLVARMDLPTG